MLIFHGLQNQDPFIDRLHVSTLSGGGGGGRGARKGQRQKTTRCSYNDGSMYTKFSTFRPKFECYRVLVQGGLEAFSLLKCSHLTE